MTNTISYFQSIPNSDFSKQSEELIELYKQSWSKHGWNPIVLNEEHSKRNELFHKLDLDNPDANFYKTIHPTMWKYHRSCYCRLLAYCQYVREHGATLYSDYDVMNYGFTPSILNFAKENSYFFEDRAVVCLGKEGVIDIEQAILQFNNQPFREGSERGSCNDMNIMNKYTNCFNFQKDQNNQNYVSSIMPDLSNQTPLVHYDGGCYRRGVDRKFSRLDIIKQYHKFSQQ